MYCPKCGVNLPDDVKFCPFCGEGLEKEEISFEKVPSESIIQETLVENEIIETQTLGEQLYDLLKSNPESAFTATALFNRLDEKIKNVNDRTFTLSTIEEELNKMVWNGLLNVEHRDGNKYYMVNSEPLTAVKVKELTKRKLADRNPYRSQGPSKFTYPTKRSNSRQGIQMSPKAITLIILGVIGGVLALSGYNFLNYSFTSGLTLLIVGIIMLVIAIGIATKGGCFCDICDC
jgi:uncharacterized Zn finger protein (UPF0148 family)